MSNSVPEGWDYKSLAEVSKFVMGQAPAGKECNKDGIGTPFVKAGEFAHKYPLVREWTTAPQKLAQRGDVLICVVGATAGKLNLGIDCAIGRSVAAIRPEKVSTLYLYNFMQQHVETLRSGSSGSAQGVITTEHLKNIFAPFPPLPEQQKIAAILSSVDDVIEKTRAQIDKLKDLKTGMMQELLTKGIGHTAFKDSPVGRIPLSWSVLNVDQLQSKEKYSCVGGPFGSDLTSKHYVDDAGVPVIRGANLPLDSRRFIDEGFVFVSDEKADSLVRNMAYPGDLVITQRGTIGQIGLIPDDSNYKRYVISQSQMKLAVDEEVIDKEFLYQFFLSDGFLRDLDKETIATGLPHINLGILKSFWVSVPPLKEQGEILRVLNSVDDKDKKLQAALATYCALKKALMQDLLTGKVRVNVDNKENAVA